MTWCDYGTVAAYRACDKEHNQISKDYDAGLNQVVRHYYTKSGYNKIGKFVCLGMENSEYCWFSEPRVSGIVNFH